MTKPNEDHNDANGRGAPSERRQDAHANQNSRANYCLSSLGTDSISEIQLCSDCVQN